MYLQGADFGWYNEVHKTLTLHKHTVKFVSGCLKIIIKAEKKISSSRSTYRRCHTIELEDDATVCFHFDFDFDSSKNFFNN